MKFTTIKDQDESDREFEIYSYLGAIDNELVEQFGLCNIYYYGDWTSEWNTKFKLMIFTYLSGNLGWPARHDYFNSSIGDNGLNTLILFRDFVSICCQRKLNFFFYTFIHSNLSKVRTSKYMHNHGVRHDDIKPDNIMIHRGRSYLIDFNLSSRLNKKSDGGTLLYGSRKWVRFELFVIWSSFFQLSYHLCRLFWLRFHKNQTRTRLDDWESFLYTMCHINKIEL